MHGQGPRSTPKAETDPNPIPKHLPRLSLQLHSTPAEDNMKQLTCIALAAVVLMLLILSGFLIVRAQRPAMPQQWSQLTRGMTPEQVRSALADEVYDLRAVQGFDLVTHMNPKGHWQMIIRYDSSGRVTNATAGYIHTSGFGLLNSAGKRVL